MPLFLDTTGNANLGIGVCGRCGFKHALVDLKPDRNRTGLIVCDQCSDDLDPYKLAPRQAETIHLPFVRPDERLD